MSSKMCFFKILIFLSFVTISSIYGGDSSPISCDENNPDHKCLSHYIQGTKDLFINYGKIHRSLSAGYFLYSQSNFLHHFLTAGQIVLLGISIHSFGLLPLTSLGAYFSYKTFKAAQSIEHIRRCTKYCTPEFAKTQGLKFSQAATAKPVSIQFSDPQDPLKSIKKIFNVTPQKYDYQEFIVEYADLMNIEQYPHTPLQIRKIISTFKEGENQGVKCLTSCSIGILQDQILFYTTRSISPPTSSDYTCKFIEYLPAGAPYDALMRLAQMMTLEHSFINTQSATSSSRLAKFLQYTNNGQHCLDIADSQTGALYDQLKERLHILSTFQEMIKEQTDAEQASLWLNNVSSTFLHESAKNGTLTDIAVQGNLEFIDSKDVQGKTPLHIATQYEKTAQVLILLKNGANLNTPDNEGKTPLHIASTVGSIPIAQILIANGAIVNIQDKKGETALDLAQNNPPIQAVIQASEILVDYVKKGLTENVKSILDSGNASLNVMDVNGNNLLMMAASSSNDTSSTIIFLIQQGMDINTINSMNGDTSLSLAVKGGFIGNVKTLIDLGANMNIQAENGKTVFDQTQDPQILGLLRANADLLQASSTGNLSQMQLSLSKGASLNVRDANGQTPLMRSCTKGAHQFISLLMGDTINAQDYDGNTALHMAARSGYSLVVKTLLENKADKKIKNLNQETPLSLAIKHIHPYSIELLSFR